MDINDIEKLVDGDPDTLIQKAAEMGIDFSGLSNDIAREIVKKKFSLNQEQFEAVDFIFWISYMVEKDAEDLITYPEVQLGARQVAMKILIERLHFGDKITVIEELYTGEKDSLLKLMRKIQGMRNDIAHGRFDNLSYGGYHLSDNRGKLKLIAHYRDVMRRKK
jgi:hypothetical protein